MVSGTQRGCGDPLFVPVSLSLPFAALYYSTPLAGARGRETVSRRKREEMFPLPVPVSLPLRLVCLSRARFSYLDSDCAPCSSTACRISALIAPLSPTSA